MNVLELTRVKVLLGLFALVVWVMPADHDPKKVQAGIIDNGKSSLFDLNNKTVDALRAYNLDML